MNENHRKAFQPGVSRRKFLKETSLATAAGAAAIAGFPAVLRGQTQQSLNAVIIGIGGRGGGAGRDFLEAAKGVGVEGKIVAVADLFPGQARRGEQHFELSEDRCFSGFDAYQKALEIPGVNYAILATPPGYRPAQFKACVEAGKHVFMEKPVAVDGPGCRIMYEAGELAKKKNLKVAAGTQRRHRPSYIETIKRLQDGAIGDIVTLRAYWVNTGPIWHRGDHGESDLERQNRNWYHYIWLSGDHICEQHVHNIDVCNWIMNDHPIKCWGLGARQQLGEKTGEIWDNFAVEFEYRNGVRMYSYCGQIRRQWGSVSEGAQGAKGVAELLDGRNIIRPHSGDPWRPNIPSGQDNGYVNEHRNLMNAILKDTELNETNNVTDSTLASIMGREAAYSGAAVEWDAMLNSKFIYGPEQVYADQSNLKFGPFRTLRPPMPPDHNILKEGFEVI
jgi:myo-inositol 2-dehydrogenase / D-chiro-inositol 1-dehydrogenase